MGNINEDRTRQPIVGGPTHLDFSPDALRRRRERDKRRFDEKSEEAGLSYRDYTLNLYEQWQRTKSKFLLERGALSLLYEVQDFWGVGEVYCSRENYGFITESEDHTPELVVVKTFITSDLTNLTKGYYAVGLIAEYPGVTEREVGRGRKVKTPSYHHDDGRYPPGHAHGPRSYFVGYETTYEYYEAIKVHGHRYSSLWICCSENNSFSNYPSKESDLKIRIRSGNGIFVNYGTNIGDSAPSSKPSREEEPIRSRDQLRQAVADYCEMQQAEGLMPQQIAQREIEHGARAPRVPRKGFLGKLFP